MTTATLPSQTSQLKDMSSITIPVEVCVTQTVGGNGGTASSSGFDQSPIVRMVAYMNGGLLQGIEFWSSQGGNWQLGTASLTPGFNSGSVVESQEFVIEENELIASATLIKAENSVSKGTDTNVVLGLLINFDSGRSFAAGMTAVGNGAVAEDLVLNNLQNQDTPLELPLKGSALLGFGGSCGTVIDNLYLFVDSPYHAVLEDIIYGELPPLPQGTPRQLDQFMLQNHSANAQQINDTKTYTKTESFTWSAGGSVTNKIGSKVEVEAQVPLLAKGKFEVSAEVAVTVSGSLGQTFTTTSTESTSINCVIPPQSSVVLSVAYYSYPLSVSFSGTLNCYRSTGTVQPVAINGTYSGIPSSKVFVTYSQPSTS